jgi:excisionase family DNA binding protein
VTDGKSGGTGARPRISAWLPPGLALGWLAVLATFVHGVGRLLGVWAATGTVVFLFVLLVTQVRRRTGSASGARPQAESNPPRTSPATTEHPQATSSHTTSVLPATEEGTAGRSVSGTASQSAQLGTAEVPVALELRILTAAEVASVLRVDTDVIIKAISDGEFPGNRIGSHWRVDQGALTRWLQGKYRDPVRPPSPAQLETDPS